MEIIGPMLEGYFDESGTHVQDTGRLYRLTLGGCIAPVENWPEFSREWGALLRDAGIQMFHMTEFEAYRGEFRDWDQRKHQRFLGSALDILTRHITEFVGFTGIESEGTGSFRDKYEETLYDACLFARNWGINFRPRNKTRLVFASHPEYKRARLTRFFDSNFADDPTIVSMSTASPLTTPGLQAADLVAFEARRHWMRFSTRRSDWRYPLRRLVESGATVSFNI